MPACRQMSLTGMPASACLRIETIWVSVNRDFFMEPPGCRMCQKALLLWCLPTGGAYECAGPAGVCEPAGWVAGAAARGIAAPAVLPAQTRGTALLRPLLLGVELVMLQRILRRRRAAQVIRGNAKSPSPLARILLPVGLDLLPFGIRALVLLPVDHRALRLSI